MAALRLPAPLAAVLRHFAVRVIRRPLSIRCQRLRTEEIVRPGSSLTILAHREPCCASISMFSRSMHATRQPWQRGGQIGQALQARLCPGSRTVLLPYWDDLAGPRGATAGGAWRSMPSGPKVVPRTVWCRHARLTLTESSCSLALALFVSAPRCRRHGVLLGVASGHLEAHGRFACVKVRFIVLLLL